jgi:hypothetical protein
MLAVVLLELRRRRLVRLRDRLAGGLAELERRAERPPVPGGVPRVREQTFEGLSVALVNAGRHLRGVARPAGSPTRSSGYCPGDVFPLPHRSEWAKGKQCPRAASTAGGVSHQEEPLMTESHFGGVTADPSIVPRTILVHLNVQVGPEDTRSADEIGAFLDDALSVGLDGHDGGEHLTVTVALADEVA